MVACWQECYIRAEVSPGHHSRRNASCLAWEVTPFLHNNYVSFPKGLIIPWLINHPHLKQLLPSFAWDWSRAAVTDVRVPPTFCKAYTFTCHWFALRVRLADGRLHCPSSVSSGPNKDAPGKTAQRPELVGSPLSASRAGMALAYPTRW